MTKDEALKMAIAEIEGWIDHAYGHTPKECADNKAIKACKKALEQPAKEWVGLSDDEIGRLTVFEGLHHVEIPLLAKFIIAIEQALKEKNEK